VISKPVSRLSGCGKDGVVEILIEGAATSRIKTPTAAAKTARWLSDRSVVGRQARARILGVSAGL
jgi:hypothetical protein